MKQKRMPAIVWDVDDVLNDLMRSWFEGHWLTAHPECRVKYEDLIENPPHRVLGVDLKAYLASLDEFRLCGEYRALKPDKAALAWFEKYGPSFRHVALTATPLRSAAVTAGWVMEHFGKWIRSFSFIPSERSDEPLPFYDRAKGEFLSWWGKADFFLDDSSESVQAAGSLNIKTMLISRPWNESNLSLKQALDLLAGSAGEGV